MTGSIFPQGSLLICLLILLSTGLACAGHNLNTFPTVVGARKVPSKITCTTAPGYTYLERDTGAWLGYETEIHSQVALTDKHFSPEDVSRIMRSVVATAIRKFPDVEPWRHTALHSVFQRTHVIVTPGNDHLQALWKKKLKPELAARVTLTRHACFQPVNNTWFFTIDQKYFKRKTSDTVVHEAMHVVSVVLFDDWQSKHDSPKFWDELDKGGSLQAEVEYRWIHRKRVPTSL